MIDAVRKYDDYYDLENQIEADFNKAVEEQYKTVLQELEDGELDILDFMEELQEPKKIKFLIQEVKFLDKNPNIEFYKLIGQFVKSIISMAVHKEAVERTLNEVM